MTQTKLLMALAALLVCACANEGPSSYAMHTLGPGSETILEGVLERSDPTWSVAPFLHEVPRECPLAHSTALPSPHHAFRVRAEGAIILNVTLERPDGASASADMSLGVYAGESLPRTSEDAGDCLAIDTASGPFPGEAPGVHVADGASVTVALWSYAFALPQRYRLALRTD